MGASPLDTAPSQPLAPAAHTFNSRVIGSNWLSVFVDQLPAPAQPASIVTHQPVAPPGKHVAVRPPVNNNLTGVLDQLATRVPAGHLITTSLLTILVTNDNRVLIGAVSPAYLEQLALSKAAQ
jgi:hypothetical protein